MSIKTKPPYFFDGLLEAKPGVKDVCPFGKVSRGCSLMA
eukprot:Gb_07757 [translate_table: standard]